MKKIETIINSVGKFNKKAEELVKSIKHGENVLVYFESRITIDMFLKKTLAYLGNGRVVEPKIINSFKKTKEVFLLYSF